MALSRTAKFTVLGAALGACFSMFSWSLDIYLLDAPLSLNLIAQIHKSNYLHFITDLAPFILAAVFYVLCRDYERVLETTPGIEHSGSPFAVGSWLTRITFLTVLVVIILTSIFVLASLGLDIAKHELDLVRYGRDIKIEITSFHLWIEELTVDNETLTEAEVFQHLEDAKTLYRDFLEVAKEAHADIFFDTTKVDTNLTELEQLGRAHVVKNRTTGLRNRVGNDFHAVYKQIFLNIDKIVSGLEKHTQAKRDQRTLLAVGIAIFISLFSGMTFLLLRYYERERSSNTAALLEHSERIALLLDSTGEAIYGIDLKGDCTFANSACMNLLAYTEESQFLGKNMHDLIHHTKSDGSLSAYEDCRICHAFLNGEEIHVDDETLWRLDGTSFPSEYRSFPIRKKGEVIGSVVSFTDITDRVAAKTALIQSEQRYRKLFDNAPIAYVLTIDEDGEQVIKDCNSAFVDLLCDQKEKIISRSLTEFYSPSRGSRGENGRLDEYGDSKQLITKGGEIIETNLLVIPEIFMEGLTIGTLHAFIDITEIKRVQAEIERVAAEWTQLIDTANSPIFGIDSKGLINEWNQQIQNITGYTKKEVLQKNLVEELFIDEYRESAREVIEKVLRGEESTNYEFVPKSKDGKRRAILLNTTARRDTAGNIVGAVGFGQDITELREKEVVLQHALKMEAVGQLTGGIAHDFNNLLSIIKGNLRILQQKSVVVSEVVTRMFDDALSATEDGVELVERLLAFSHTKAVNVQLVDTNEAIEMSLRLLTRTLGDHIDVVFEGSDDDLYIKANRGQFDNALLNLAINARDAMIKGGKLTIMTRRVFLNQASHEHYSSDKYFAHAFDPLPEGVYVEVTVSDTGIGIEPEDLERLYEPFYTTKDVGKGSGLGLSMVYKFMQQSQGSSRIKSTPGEGTTVSLLFPAVDERIQDNDAVPTEKNLKVGSGTVLVVEDEARVRRVAVYDLKRLGFDILEAENAQAAMTLFESNNSVVLLFSDVLMPGGIDGVGLAKWVRTHYPDVKVLLTTGYSKDLFNDKNNNIIPFPVIRKPYSIENLTDKISLLLELR
ncbi:MAG: PAS domain S-box protein [Gammaproteobacteria bacterium]|nr:PAS domain S-box protein [Gammaproteobacteria bacterium]